MKKPTLGSQFKSSLIALMQTIDSTNVHYIRCIKPNEAKQAWEVEPQNVLGQLRACGVLETIRISCAGYPSRWTFDDFGSRYYLLANSSKWNLSARELTEHLLGTLVTEEDKYQIGLTKIFFRAGMLAALESMRSERLNAMVTVVQKNMRRKMAMNHYRKLRQATIKIQTWWRGIAARKLAENLRKVACAMRLQVAIRRHVQRKAFLDIRRGIVLVQSRKSQTPFNHSSPPD